MDTASYIQAIISLLFVLGLIGLASIAFKKLSEKHFPTAVKDKKRLSIIEVRPIDTRRRLMLVRRDDVEHLVLLGTTGEIVIESGIKAPKSQNEESK